MICRVCRVSRAVSYKVQKSNIMWRPRWTAGFAVNIHRFFPLAKFNVKECCVFRNHLQMPFQTLQTLHFWSYQS